MKVIAQLIRHFWQRGALTPVDAAYLVQHGFVRARDLPGYAGSDPACIEASNFEPFALTALVDPPEGLELLEEQLVRRSGRGRRTGKPKTTVLDAKELCHRVQAEFDRRPASFKTLVALAERVEPCERWQAATGVLRRISAKRFSREMSAFLRADPTRLRSLWLATEIEPFHRLVQDHEFRGRSVNAYAALLVAADPAALGKYAWLLQHEEMQCVANLRFIHHRLLANINRLYHRDRRLLGRTLETDCPTALFWGLVLLHNANRLNQPGLHQRTRDYGPLHQPAEDLWRQAWTVAMNLDRPLASQLFVTCYADLGSRANDADASPPLYCPSGWHAPEAS